jgi:hypothetical protein
VLAIAEIFRIGVAVAQSIADQNCGLPGQLNPLAAFVAGHQIVQPHHVRSRFREFNAILATSAARQFLALGAYLPAHRRRKFIAAARAKQLLRFIFFPFGIKRALIHS